METKAANTKELIDAIENANLKPDETWTIELTGEEGDYEVREGWYELFGKNAFPIITGRVVINGRGRTISRPAIPDVFRFFGVNANGGNPDAYLEINKVHFHGGDSRMGGGAIVNDGTLVVRDCIFHDNRGSHGGAIYAGDAHTTEIYECLFFHNYATEQGGAIFGASTSNLVIQGCMCFENASHYHDNSIYMNNGDNNRIEGCTIWDGVTYGRLYGTWDVQPSVSGGSIDPAWLEFGQNTQLSTEQMDKLKSLWQLTYQKRELPSWARFDISYEAQGILERAVENNKSPLMEIDQLIYQDNGQLADLAKALRQQIEKTDFYSGILSMVVQRLATSHREKSIPLLLEFAPFQRQYSAATVAAMLASNHTIEAITQLYKTFNESIPKYENEYFPYRQYRYYMLAALVQELIVRGHQPFTVPAIGHFVEQESRGYNLFSQLPQMLTEIESDISRYAPSHLANGSKMGVDFPVSNWSASKKVLDREEYEVPAYREIQLTFEEQTFINAIPAITGLGNSELKMVEFLQPIDPREITEELLLSLKLNFMEQATELEIRPVALNVVMNTLFAVASNGNLEHRGQEAAFGRKSMWSAMAGLTGAKKEDSFETIEALGKTSKWFEFAFQNSVTDECLDYIFLAVLRPDRRTFIVIISLAPYEA